MKERVKRILRLVWLRAICLLPTRVPNSYKDNEQFLDDIVLLAGPIAEPRSMKWLVSSEMMHQPSGKHRIPMFTFVKILRKFAANQFAANKLQELKEEQQKEVAEATAKSQQEKAAADSVKTKETATN